MPSSRKSQCESLAQFRARAEAGYRQSNPDAVGMVFTWESAEAVTFPTGMKGYVGHFVASAPGFATRRGMATASPYSMTVR